MALNPTNMLNQAQIRASSVTPGNMVDSLGQIDEGIIDNIP
jgi:hypothetical protein